MSYLIGLFVLYNAENLEEYGIRPGASAPEDEDRELTDEEKAEQIKSIMGYLPDDLQELFGNVLKQTDPVQEAAKYEQEVQSELRRIGIENGTFSDNQDMRMIDDDGDALWMQTQKNIFESQYSQSDDPSKRFNVSDWI